MALLFEAESAATGLLLSVNQAVGLGAGLERDDVATTEVQPRPAEDEEATEPA